MTITLYILIGIVTTMLFIYTYREAVGVDTYSQEVLNENFATGLIIVSLLVGAAWMVVLPVMLAMVLTYLFIASLRSTTTEIKA